MCEHIQGQYESGADCGGPVVLLAACEVWLLVSVPPGNEETIEGMRRKYLFLKRALSISVIGGGGMIVVEPIFTFDQFVLLPKPEMLVLLHHSGLNGTTPLPTVDVTVLTEDDAVRNADAAGTLPSWQVSALDDVPGQRYASVAGSGLGHRWVGLPVFPAPYWPPYSPLLYLAPYRCSFVSRHLVVISYCPFQLPQLTLVAVLFRPTTTILVDHNSVL